MVGPPGQNGLPYLLDVPLMHAVRFINAHQHKATKNIFPIYCTASSSMEVYYQQLNPSQRAKMASSSIHSSDVPNDNREARVAAVPTLSTFSGL